MNDHAAARLAVIIPAYNAESYIERALRSVLGQSCRDIRVVVINDGSTDSTADILAALSAEDGRLSFLTVPNAGPAAARNRALELLDHQTEYVMFMDADDELLPDAVEYALEGARDADPGAVRLLHYK